MDKVISPRIKAIKRCSRCNVEKVRGEFSEYKYITNNGKESVRLDSRCKDCNRERRLMRYKENPKAQLESSRKWKESNAEHLKSYRKKRQQNEKHKENKALAQRRRKARIRARTSKADSDEIKSIYKEAARMTKEQGIQYHVDHIIPLSKGGKHEIENLQILTASKNLKKGVSLTSLPLQGGLLCQK